MEITTATGVSLEADVGVEDFIYYYYDRSQGPVDESAAALEEVTVSIQSVQSTRGGNIVSSEHDVTGLLVWPATHLLAQYLALFPMDWLRPIPPTRARRILEVGCGCGLVGIAGLLAASSAARSSLYVATDMDSQVLEFCRANYVRNGLPMRAEEHVSALPEQRGRGGVLVQALTWGDEEEMQTLESLLTRHGAHGTVDLVVGADIVYPTTSAEVILKLLHTVDHFLDDLGVFLLSFATRDGPTTPGRLIEAASLAGFAIMTPPRTVPMSLRQRLPPLLDSQILCLKRDPQAATRNATLGGMDCSLFPGLQERLARRDAPSSDEEDWMPPLEDDLSEDETTPP
jgi:predicted nicotinamide N-methyase